jgi:hypothetical protein
MDYRVPVPVPSTSIVKKFFISSTVTVTDYECRLPFIIHHADHVRSSLPRLYQWKLEVTRTEVLCLFGDDTTIFLSRSVSPICITLRFTCSC